MFFSILDNGLIIDETKKCAGIALPSCILIVEDFFENATVFFKDLNLKVVSITYDTLDVLLKEIPAV